MGVILYEMISGRPPFQSEDTVEVLTRVVAGNRPPLADVCPDAPPAVVELIESALSPERAKRPANAGEFAARLQQAVFGTATPMAGVAAVSGHSQALDRPELVELDLAPRPRRGKGKLVAGLVTLSLAAAGALFLLKNKPTTLAGFPALKAVAGLVKGPSGGDEKPTNLRAAAGEVVWVKFNVIPAHSRIYLDGQPIPSNPAPLTRGQMHNVTAIADGYEIEQMDIKGTSVGTIHLRLEKKKKPRRR